MGKQGNETPASVAKTADARSLGRDGAATTTGAPGGGNGDFRQALDGVGQWVESEGKAPVPILSVLKIVLMAVLRVAGFRVISDADKQKRPPGEGLQAGFDQLVDFKERHPTGVGADIQIDVPQARALSGKITLFTGLATLIMRFAQNALRNLAACENEAARTFNSEYGAIRALVQRNPDYQEEMEEAESYAGSRSAKAVQSRAHNKKKMTGMAEEAQQRATAQAKRQAREDLSTELQSFLDEMHFHNQTLGATPDTAPATPATFTPGRPAHRPTHHKKG